MVTTPGAESDDAKSLPMRLFLVDDIPTPIAARLRDEEDSSVRARVALFSAGESDGVVVAAATAAVLSSASEPRSAHRTRALSFLDEALRLLMPPPSNPRPLARGDSIVGVGGSSGSKSGSGVLMLESIVGASGDFMSGSLLMTGDVAEAESTAVAAAVAAAAAGDISLPPS